MKKLFFNLIYALLISTIFLSMDKLYMMHNSLFIFEFTFLEFLKKMFLLILFISIVPEKVIRLSLLFVLILFSSFQYIHFEYFGRNIQGIEFYLFFTEIGETFETLGSMLFLIKTPLIIMIISTLLIYLIDKSFKEKLYFFKYAKLLFLTMLIGVNLYIYIIINVQHKRLSHFHTKWICPMIDRHSSRNFFVSLNYFMFGIMPQKLCAATSDYPPLKKPIILHSDMNRTIILFIGESLRYDKLNIEQNNNLTPNLKSMKNKHSIFLKKIYAGGTATKVSVATLINRLKYPKSFLQITEENNCLFKLAKENHLHTYFISRQENSQLEMIRDTICPKYIDNFIYQEKFVNYITPIGYDEDLQKVFQKLNILKANNFIVLQHRGSHSPYTKQYPKAFNKYPNSYDNTVLYTDYTLSKFIQYIQKNIKNEVFFFYVSDHGEMLGEQGKRGHGTLDKEVYEVPLIMYTNSLDSKVQESFKHIKSHYDLSNYILSLLGYSSEPLESDKDIYILNSDIDAYSGYGMISVTNGVESNITMTNLPL